MVFFVLYEHAVGYALFRCHDVEDIGSLLPEVQEAVTEFSRFSEVASLESFFPFKNGTNALDNINSVSEGIMHEDLQTFLSNNLPSGKKRRKVVLGVGDSKLGGAVQESLEVNCQSGGVVNEILRGIRLYFHRMVKGLSALSVDKAQLGLGHSYSRARVKFNVNRADNMIIQSISLLDQLDKNINTFCMRIKEWYSYHFPELVKLVSDNYTFARVASYIGDRKQFGEDKVDGLEEILMDSVKSHSVVEAARVSMGMDISPIDLVNIQMFASRVIGLVKYRAELNEYLSQRMNNVAPNLTTLIGEQVGARLISHAGSLTNLAKYPASTVQILGAEKALFRALKTRGNTPKYGLIFHSSFIGRAGTKNKGRISRYLANKCAIASRIDCFTDHPSITFGEKLKGQVEERLSFYETGAVPRKNITVMKDAIMEVEKLKLLSQPSSEKKKKKKRKRELVEEDDVADSMEIDKDATAIAAEEEKPKKKKKKSKKSLD